MKLFSGSSNRPLAEKIAIELKTKVSPSEIFVFPDGERRIQIQDTVVDEDVVIIQPTTPPAEIHYFELFFWQTRRKEVARKVLPLSYRI